MKYFIIFFLMISGSGHALTTGWNDCSTPLYSWPYGFEDSPKVVAILSHDVIENEIKLAIGRKSQAKNNLRQKPDLDIDPSKVSKKQMEELLQQSQTYIDAANEYKAMIEYRDIDHARFSIVYEEYVKTGKEVVKDEGSNARFMDSTFTSCRMDVGLMKKIIALTLKNLETKYDKEYWKKIKP